MFNLFLVTIGGAAGAAARYGVSGVMLRFAGPGWPWGTFIVNLVGSLLIGFLAGWLAHRGDAANHMRLLVGVGVLGGFTTFSAFSLETALMVQRKEWTSAAIYSLGSVVLGLAAVFAGLWLARRLFA